MTDLKRHWLRALDASAAAIEAGSRAHVLPAGVVRLRTSRLTAERAWVEVVNWSALEPGDGGSIVTLEPLPDVAEPRLGKAA